MNWTGKTIIWTGETIIWTGKTIIWTGEMEQIWTVDGHGRGQEEVK